ncbi:MAG: hypothetical protein OEV74_07205 [Cyclobacteriaceae bacterium]|nr:hypothetical protein [Cyclobacteriaceae bacterium]MDH4296048.1 hypothetical protein [Cyclobacteriaceae bacterium]MDH5249816.1 hypothetical protein [Cyclobacteriaceae bacterium]
MYENMDDATAGALAKESGAIQKKEITREILRYGTKEYFYCCGFPVLSN